jgi:serine/threonine-protein kinase
MRAMTPDYASPEQMRGEEITPASDVYSLGVLLYELLTGQRPFRLDDKPLHEAVRIVSEDDPPRPSAIRMKDEGGGTNHGLSSFRPHPSSLQGDLDNIVLLALHKSPTARYPTVAALRADLERHLRHEPVTAREPTWSYRANRFVRRHRLGVTVAALLLAGLLIALGAALWQAHTARLEARQARRMLYLTQMQQAARQLEQGVFAEVRAILTRWQPSAGAEDVRGFEWFYLWREAHRERLELHHTDWVGTVAWAPDGKKIASAGQDRLVKVWDARTGAELLVFKGHTGTVVSVAFSPTVAGWRARARISNCACGTPRPGRNSGASMLVGRMNIPLRLLPMARRSP